MNILKRQSGMPNPSATNRYKDASKGWKVGKRIRTALAKSRSIMTVRPIHSNSPSIIRTEASDLSAACFTTVSPTSPSPYN